MGDIIISIDSLEKSGLLIDGATETVKHDKGNFFELRWHQWLIL